MITAPNVRFVYAVAFQLEKTVPDLDRDKKLEDVRSLLESVALLETVAAEREAKVENLMETLAAEGMAPEELAEELDISHTSVKSILNRDEPKPVHERLGLSEETVARLDPLGTGTEEADSGS